jgi:hypothetical protein
VATTSTPGPLSFVSQPTLRSTDYPAGLASQDDVAKLFTQLQPIVSQVTATSQTTITRESQTFTVVMPQSDWQGIANTNLVNGWAVGPGPALTNQDNTQTALAWRIDQSGTVWLHGNLTNAGAGGVAQFLSTANPLPTVATPEIAWMFSVLASGAITGAGALTVGSNGTLGINLLPAQNPSTYQFLVTWPQAARVPGFAGGIKGANNAVGNGFPFTVQFQHTTQPTSVRLSVVTLNQTPLATGQTNVWQLGSQPPHVAIGACWSYVGGGTIMVNSVPGLALGASYQVTVEAFF